MLNIAEAKAAAARINAANQNRIRDERLRRYQEYRAEYRACGYEVETFEDYCRQMDGISAKDDAMDRLMAEQMACPHAYLDA